MALVLSSRALQVLPVHGAPTGRGVPCKLQPNGVLPTELQNNAVPFKTAEVMRKGTCFPGSSSHLTTDLAVKRGGPDHGDRPGAGGARRAALVWFRSDLRLHDHEALLAAHREASSVLPVFCFDPRDFSRHALGFEKTGPYRAKFLLECVADLRARLRDRGSDLLIRVGKPEEVLTELCRQLGASAVYCTGEVTAEEVAVENRVATALESISGRLKRVWGSTLFHLEDLPFPLQNMPGNYGDFRLQLRQQGIRPPWRLPQS
eukprot:jgi/Botrbrau1/15374/Bobra.43_2s0005.1